MSTSKSTSKSTSTITGFKQFGEVPMEKLIALYVETQLATVQQTVERLRAIEQKRDVTGWMLLECHVLDGSRLGERTLVPYGPGCTFKEVPTHPISPRGLASDMSVVMATALVVKS